jgi:hypothetical protein
MALCLIKNNVRQQIITPHIARKCLHDTVSVIQIIALTVNASKIRRIVRA